MALNDSSDDDWFTKDEDDLLAQLQNKAKPSEDATASEKISLPTTDELISCKIKASQLNETTSKSKESQTLRTDQLNKLCQLDALDLFLFIHTKDVPFNVYLDNQISANDSKKRVLLYLQLLSKVCALELEGFQQELLQFFAGDKALLQSIGFLMESLFKRHKGQWTDENEIDEFIENTQRLLLTAYQARVLDEDGWNLLMTLKTIIKQSTDEAVLKRAGCAEFLKQLNAIDGTGEKTEEQHKHKAPTIYPTLAELSNLENTLPDNLCAAKCSYETTAEYIQQQMLMLREDFMISLRACVQSFKHNHHLENMPKQKLWENVHITLNTAMDSRRHEMLLVKINCKTCENFLNLKVGALLCLTTSFDMDNLVLATVTFTPLQILQQGYLGIEIVRQYNIGNFYDKSMFMFETPAFFEPYRNVYNYLSNCNVHDFPMQNYIVFGEKATKPPTYMKCDMVYQVGKHEWRPLTEAEPTLKKLPLDVSQQRAFKHALTNDFTLIQGPPGTGKTHLSVQIVKTLLENVHKAGITTPIVIITYTNESLDKFLLQLSSNSDAKILRFGGQTTLPEIRKFNVPIVCDAGAVNPALKRLYYTTNLEYKASFESLQKLHQEFDGSEESYQIILKAQNDLRDIQSKLNTIRVMFQYYWARDKSIIAMTTTFAARTNYLFRFLKSAIVIFEEAAEILESHILACLTPYTQHVIMIGDHMQLQPYTSSYEHTRSCELNVSLFERLIKQGMQHVALNIQYRMRPLIAELICPAIYERLKNAVVVESYPLVKGMRKNLFCVQHKEMEQAAHEHECSRYNDKEIQILLQLATYLLKCGHSAKDIAILSPYSQQIKMFRKQVVKKNLKIRACTVDSFQGLEANIILLSLVRSNKENEIGFLRQKNRVCVALSRAKHGLYIAGNLQFLAQNSKIWRQIMMKFQLADAIGDTFPYEDSNV